MTTTDQTDLITVIVSDHRIVEAIFRELETGQGSAEHRRQLADHAITELVRHTVVEEQFLYPAAREHLDNGDEVANREIEEHAEAERLMKDLEYVEVTDGRFDDLVGKLIEDVRHHIKDEEEDLLPRLRQACSDKQLRELGEWVLQAKTLAPTRPHPSAPDTPPANLIVGPGAGLVDRIRDALSKRS